MLQFIEPLTGTGGPSCSKQPESVGPVCSAVWSNPIVIPNQVGFVRLSQIGDFRGCKTQGCDGNLVPVAVKSTRLGGGLSVFFGCDGCKVKSVIFESFTKYEHGPARNNDISVSVQVAFIIAHAVYCKTLQNALGMNTVETIGKMYPVVKAMVDDLCEVAKREMKDKNDGDLG